MPAGPTPVEELSDKYILFEIGGQHYALPLQKVEEVIWMVALTPTPSHHEHIEGVINLRGNILPVLNIRHRLGLPPVPYGIHHRILVVQVGGHQVGVIVDSVARVEEFRRDQVEEPREFDEDARFVTGLIKLNDRIIFCIDLSGLFSPREIRMAKEVAGSASQSGTLVGRESRSRSKAE